MAPLRPCARLSSILLRRPEPSVPKPSPFYPSPRCRHCSASSLGDSSRPTDVTIATSSHDDASEHIANGHIGIFHSFVDAPIASLDYFQHLTGLPWWATISISAVALRALLFPLRIAQEKKVEEIKKLGPKLKLEQLAKGAFEGRFLQEYRLLRNRKLMMSSPSLLWLIGPGIFIQVPVVLTIMYSLRKMALEQHTGFCTGGMLWFKDLTIAGDGFTGMVLPFIIAGTYFTNIHVLFRGRPVRQGPYGTFLKIWGNVLKFSTALIFLSFYHVPQATHMFFVPHSILTLTQTIFFENKGRHIHGEKSAIFMPQNEIISNAKTSAELTSYENLLKDAGMHFTSGNASEAIEMLKNAIKEEPEEEQAYALLGLVYKTRKDWVNSAIYYEHAILKGKTDDFKVAAYAGCGLALLKQGAVSKCIETMRGIRNIKVPEDAQGKHLYYAALVILSRALSEAGLSEESREVKDLAVKLDTQKMR